MTCPVPQQAKAKPKTSQPSYLVEKPKTSQSPKTPYLVEDTPKDNGEYLRWFDFLLPRRKQRKKTLAHNTCM